MSITYYSQNEMEAANVFVDIFENVIYNQQGRNEDDNRGIAEI